ncbi:MAG TPA: MaoC family dehydratase [Blastocatellia bacterium]|nr:MaoC family dehydratase [Blastocatellia bacterium]
MTNELPVYRVRARNTSAESENKIHDDTIAAGYGFRGGLVPGVTVFAYMTAPIVEAFGSAWLERGSMQVKFHLPFYEGDEVTVRAEVDAETEPVKIAVRAERSEGTVCATALATVDDRAEWMGEARIESYPEAALPDYEARPEATRDSIVIGASLGTLKERIDLADRTQVEMLDERLDIYYGAGAIAHPFVLLGLANKVLMHNFRLGPWIHAASDIINRGVARDGEEISVRGRIADRFERKGHEFVVLDLLLVADENRAVEQVRHTAIYRPRVKN